MKETYEIIYDFCNSAVDAYNLCEHFEGTWNDLQSVITEMKEEGCYNINITCIGDCY